MPKVAILDYGVGNLFSLKTALERKKANVMISRELPTVNDIDGLILPGVGSFTAAATKLVGKHQKIEALVDAGTPVLGICLGMQLFFEKSSEGRGKGLGLIDGEVFRLPPSVKVPHMGWNTIRLTRDNEFVDGVDEDSWVYFVHSYYPNPETQRATVAETEYGVRFPAVLAERNVYGTQFHPEKSSKTGLRILENFLSICRR